MTRRPDLFTSSVDGAAAYERMRGLDSYDASDVDQPDAADLQREAAEAYFASVNAYPTRPGQVRRPAAQTNRRSAAA